MIMHWVEFRRWHVCYNYALFEWWNMHKRDRATIYMCLRFGVDWGHMFWRWGQDKCAEDWEMGFRNFQTFPCVLQLRPVWMVEHVPTGLGHYSLAHVLPGGLGTHVLMVRPGYSVWKIEKNGISWFSDVSMCTTTTPCLNGGACTDGIGPAFTCTCASGWTGTTCQTGNMISSRDSNFW